MSKATTLLDTMLKGEFDKVVSSGKINLVAWRRIPRSSEVPRQAASLQEQESTHLPALDFLCGHHQGRSNRGGTSLLGIRPDRPTHGMANSKGTSMDKLGVPRRTGLGKEIVEKDQSAVVTSRAQTADGRRRQIALWIHPDDDDGSQTWILLALLTASGKLLTPTVMESDYEGNKLTVAQLIAAVSISLFYFDYFLTFTREVEWFWFARNRFSWASLFFFANRYVSVLGHLPYIYEFFSFRNDPGRLKTCVGLRSFREIICFITQIFVGFFLITRTYALWNRSKYVLWLLMGISIPVIAYTIAIFAVTQYEYHRFTYEDLRPYTCLVQFSSARSYKMLSSWICVLVLDTVVFLLSVYKVIQIATTKERPPILHLLMRDGIVYFGLVSLGCLASVLTYWPNVLINDGYSRGSAEILANSLSSALASRLFLNLRDPTLSPECHVDHYLTGTRFDFVHPHRRRGIYPDDDNNSGQGHDRTMTVQLRTLDELPELEEESPSDGGMGYGHHRKHSGASFGSHS